MAMKWYKFESRVGHKYQIANPSFEQTGESHYVSGYRVSEAEFNRVLAEWEADQQATEPEPVESQWVPKVGPIDKLGWWLIDGDVCIVNAVDPSPGSRQPWMALRQTGDGPEVEWLFDDTKGVFIAEITDEELVAYHRKRIVPKCPVEVKA